MTIPIPGAGVVYSLLKDVWSWGSTWLRGRRFAPDVFRGWTVDQWYEPKIAMHEFEPEQLAACINAEEWEKGVLIEIICDRLRRRLISGELVARGFREPLSPGAPSLTISRQEWRVIKLERQAPVGKALGLPDRAESGGTGWEVLDRAAGGGIAYVGLTIGKPGTKRVFRRGR